VCLAGFTFGFILMVGGAGFGNPKVALAGMLLLVVASLTRGWLRRRGKFEYAEGTLQAIAEPGPPSDAARVDELVGLLRQWNALESRRGSAAFDPWALQSIRHDIRVMVDADPALERLFHDHQRAA
jgi:hypothetical protein